MIAAEAIAREEELGAREEELGESTDMVTANMVRYSSASTDAARSKQEEKTVDDWQESLRSELQHIVAEQVKALGAQLLEELRPRLLSNPAAMATNPGQCLRPYQCLWGVGPLEHYPLMVGMNRVVQSAWIVGCQGIYNDIAPSVSRIFRIPHCRGPDGGDDDSPFYCPCEVGPGR